MDGNLEGAQHADVEVTAAHHREAVCVVEIAATRQQGNRLLSGVDQFPVFLAGGRCGAHAQQAILALQEYLTLGGKVVRNLGGQSDAKVDVGALWNVAGDAGGHLVAVETVHCALSFQAAVVRVADPAPAGAISTTRWTKMPGVTTTSGSMSPSGTIHETWAMVVLAAIAMIAPVHYGDLKSR